MTVRLKDPPIYNTEKLLEEILKVILAKEGERVLFLCPPSQGEAIVQRIRVMISRNRKSLIAKGKRPKRFQLKSSFHYETHNSKRWQACVLWVYTSDQNQMLQTLEGLLSDG